MADESRPNVPPVASPEDWANTQSGSIRIPTGPSRRTTDVKGETPQKFIKRVVNVESMISEMRREMKLWRYAFLIACAIGVFGDRVARLYHFLAKYLGLS